MSIVSHSEVVDVFALLTVRLCRTREKSVAVNGSPVVICTMLFRRLISRTMEAFRALLALTESCLIGQVVPTAWFWRNGSARYN